MTTTTGLQVEDWGRTAYAAAHERQRALVEARLAGVHPDTLVLTEHDPVYTIGLRSGADRHLVWAEAECRAAGIEVVRTNRGGDITYHGPGQLVGYPIVDLSSRRDLHAYLRLLESVLIGAVARFGIRATQREGLTGIWVGSRKIAAIGVAVRRWVAYHGFALNVRPDLNHFAGIVPCGIAPRDGTVTSLALERGTEISLAEARAAVVEEFQEHWPRFLAART